MNAILMVRDEKREQTLLYLTRPSLWGLWPFLPLVRRRAGRLPDEGVLFDALRSRNLPGYECTVFHANVYALPTTLPKLLALSKEVYTTPEQIVDAGWVVD